MEVVDSAMVEEPRVWNRTTRLEQSGYVILPC